MIGTSISAQLG